MKTKVGIFLFDGVETLDFSGPFEVFSSAKINDELAFEVFTLAQEKCMIQSYGGLKTQVDFSIDAHPKLDLLIIPGGYGVDKINLDLIGPWLHQLHEQKTILASVCTGAFILAQSKLLNGLQATTHFEDVDILERDFPEIQVVKNVRFVNNGQIMCSAGISAGIDLSLFLVEQFKGKKSAEKCRKRMEWNS
jgi:transcriptional regulator GlxA family with amidase domain